MKINLFAATVATTAMLSAAAQAADTTYYEPTPQPAYAVQPQTTNWQGFYAGVQAGGGRFSAGGNSDTALLGGVHAGYLWQNGQFVAGPEVDVDWTGWNVGGTKVNPVVHAKIRAGVAVGNALVTGSIGYGHAWAEAGGTKSNDGGLTAGAGVDFSMTDHIVTGADYLYHHVNDFSPGTTDTNSHALRIRMSYKFN